MAKFKIYGDYGYTTETLLEEFDHQTEAVRWAKYYAESSDFGGYSIIEVAEFAEDGEYIPVIRFDVEDYVADEDYYEGDDDFAVLEDF
jgi:hypothetical protein